MPAPRTAVGPDPTGSAKKGLCQAFAGRATLPGKSTAAANLLLAAQAAGQTIEQFCASVSATTVPAPEAPSSPGNSSNSNAGGNGNGSSGAATPPDTTDTPGNGNGNGNGGGHGKPSK